MDNNGVEEQTLRGNESSPTAPSRVLSGGESKIQSSQHSVPPCAGNTVTQSPFLTQSPTTCTASASADSTVSGSSFSGGRQSGGSPHVSPSQIPGDLAARPVAAGADAIPFVRMSPKFSNGSSPSMTNNGGYALSSAQSGGDGASGSAVAGGGRRIAASSTLSALIRLEQQKTTAPSPFTTAGGVAGVHRLSATAAAFPAGHQLPNFQASGGAGPGSVMQRSPVEAYTRSPLMSQNDIIIDAASQPKMSHARGPNDPYGSRDGGGWYAGIRGGASGGAMGSEYDGYRQSPQVTVGCNHFHMGWFHFDVFFSMAMSTCKHSNMNQMMDKSTKYVRHKDSQPFNLMSFAFVRSNSRPFRRASSRA